MALFRISGGTTKSTNLHRVSGDRVGNISSNPWDASNHRCQCGEEDQWPGEALPSNKGNPVNQVELGIGQLNTDKIWTWQDMAKVASSSHVYFSIDLGWWFYFGNMLEDPARNCTSDDLSLKIVCWQEQRSNCGWFGPAFGIRCPKWISCWGVEPWGYRQPDSMLEDIVFRPAVNLVLGFCLCARWWFGGSWYDVESVAGLKKPTNWQLIEFSEVWQESYDNLVAVLNAGIDDMDSGSINRLTSYGHRIPTRDDLNWLVTHMTGETPPNEDAEYYHINSTNRTDGKQACKGRACDQSSGKGPRFQGGKGVVLIESNHETKGIASVEGHASTAYCKVLVCRLEYLGVIVLSYRFHISSWVMPIQDFSYSVYSQFQYSQMDVGKDFATYTQTSGQNHLTRDLEEAHVPSSH